MTSRRSNSSIGRRLQMAAEKLAVEPPSLVGRKLGPYQVQVLLGSGGMGDVYRARDTRLNRIVAIKVLPRHLLERADLRQRFEREARAIASLDHPHICALYDIGREGATDFLVMQYLDGETLSQRLRKGPLPTAEVMRFAVEIAGALEQAHRQRGGSSGSEAGQHHVDGNGCQACWTSAWRSGKSSPSEKGGLQGWLSSGY